MKPLADLWAGRLPLPDAFWTYAIFWGFLINLAAVIASLAMLVVAGGGAQPAAWAAPAALALHMLPMPYNILVLVGVWRSAARPEVTPTPRLLARCAVVLWTGGMVLV